MHLLQHFRDYPALQPEDIFKFLFQSAFGCEHLVSDPAAALRYIQNEYATVGDKAPSRTEPLDGDYSRVHLGVLRDGLRPETLARLFCLSAKSEPDGKERLADMLATATALVQDGKLPLNAQAFLAKADAWQQAGCPAVHHSEAFRQAYHPAYRVLARRYVQALPLLKAIDRLPAKQRTVLAIEGGSASGKSTLAALLQEVYGCTVFHTDDFFLRPEQRSAQRLAEVGGNLDRERLAYEILQPLTEGKEICYRRFDCATQTLGAPICVTPSSLTVVEGVYALHPDFGKYYDLAVFLQISPTLQRERILERNPGALANRFFNEWIPLENTYFTKMEIPTRTDLLLPVHEE